MASKKAQSDAKAKITVESDRLRQRVMELVDDHPNNARWVEFLCELIDDLQVRREAALEEAEETNG